MPWNGSGVFVRKHDWTNEAAVGTPILPNNFDDDTDDIVGTGLGNCITRDGQGGPTAHIPWSNFRITLLGTPLAPSDAATAGYVDTATGNRSMGGFKITNLADPTAAQDAATRNYVLQVAMNAALPNQAGNTDKMVTTDGANASWSDLIKVGTMKLADSAAPTKRAQFVLSGITAGQTRTVTLRDRNAILGPDLQLDSRTANAQLTVADIGKFVDITSGTFTQTFDACANLQSGWWIRLRNSGTGDITLDPNGAELIDGLASYVMYPGEVRDIQCDGTKLTSVVIKGYRRRFTSSGTWTKPPGYTEHAGRAASAGASGDKSAGSTLARGGPSGGVFPFQIPDSFLGATETVTIGAGGAAQTVSSTSGNSGGNTSFGSWITVNGAIMNSSTAFGGQYSGIATPVSNNTVVGFEAIAVNSNGPFTQIPAYGGTKGSDNGSTASGSALYGGGAGGSIDAANVIRAPGTSKFAGNGGAAVLAGAGGIAGTFPCGGGGATQTGTASGAGANGYLDVWGIV